MNKKGLSAVIISLLLVALAIVITGILWAVISNLINEGLGDLTFSGIHTEIKPTRTEYNPETQTWEITLEQQRKRKAERHGNGLQVRLPRRERFMGFGKENGKNSSREREKPTT